MRSSLFWDSALRSVPEERRSQWPRGGSLKSRNFSRHCIMEK